MQLAFTKMEGCGNDYVYVNGISQDIDAKSKPSLVRKLSDRHFGIGGDGVIFINASERADFEMEMYNADGSRGEMCGNGIRCVAKYVYDKGLTDRKEISVESFGKIKYLTLTVEKPGVVTRVRVNMGPAILEASEIPARPSEDAEKEAQIIHGMLSKAEQDNSLCGLRQAILRDRIAVNGEMWHVTCVSMGNPHAVVFVPDVDTLDLPQIGPYFENHDRFPNRINTEFVQIIDPSHVKMRVWERGTGETLACGTGCCATAVACILNGMTQDRIEVQVLGGRIEVEWDRGTNTVWMTGPATTVFEGSIEI